MTMYVTYAQFKHIAQGSSVYNVDSVKLSESLTLSPFMNNLMHNSKLFEPIDAAEWDPNVSGWEMGCSYCVVHLQKLPRLVSFLSEQKAMVAELPDYLENIRKLQTFIEWGLDNIVPKYKSTPENLIVLLYH